MIEAMVELRQCVRSLVRTRAFTVAAILTLGLGIGATTAMFSVTNVVILRPLHFADPDRLVRLFESSPARDLEFFSVSVPNYLDWKAQSRAFVGFAAWERQREVAFASADGGAVALAARVEASLFDVLGLSPAAGRFFASADDLGGTPAVISYGLWQRRFGGEASAIGSSVQLDGVPHTVVGVLPRTFDLPGNPAEIFTPLVPSPSDQRDNRFLRVIGRVRPGVSEADARADLRRVAATLAAEYPETNRDWTANSTSLNELAVGRGYRRAVLILLCVSALVLLIAGANVANLILVRNTAREQELVVRAALGASTMRLAGYLLLESTLLTLAGAAFGLLLCLWLIDLAKVAGPIGLPRLEEIAIDGRVLGFTLAVAALVAVLGLVPALHSARRTMQPVLRQGRRLIGSGGGSVNAWLVAGQVMLTVVLLVPAALLVQSFVNLQRVESGFQPAGLAA
ncbi:MAG TPA: ABC transporter permease, partial [Longimicrobiales bacterium]|nr:ABC transporter permease [Longimicrobiales bacterium]